MSDSIELVVPPPLNRSSSLVPMDDYKSPVPLILTVCGNALSTLDSKPIAKENILDVLHVLMQAVEAIKDLGKADKKTLVLECLNWLINQQANMSVEDRSFLLQCAEKVAPPAIEVIIAVVKGVSSLKASSCLPCFK